jgi:hypothetical protein
MTATTCTVQTLTTASEIRTIARRADQGHARDMNTFKRLAREAGYEGRGGGWIYDRNGRQVTQGWGSLACRVRYSMVPATEFAEAAERLGIRLLPGGTVNIVLRHDGTYEAVPVTAGTRMGMGTHTRIEDALADAHAYLATVTRH